MNRHPRRYKGLNVQRGGHPRQTGPFRPLQPLHFRGGETFFVRGGLNLNTFQQTVYLFRVELRARKAFARR
ncbi:MAG: hypothetical protein HYU36_02960 [Planctomycetes bacterium]|nr:hypothetical protein [Planctomycetota bacterium]